MSSSTNPSIVGSALVKRGLADMLRGGVIMDVVNPEQAKIAEDAGAVAVMALERVPADIRRDGGVARMSDPRFRAFAERAKRAILDSHCANLPLPNEVLGKVNVLTFRFSP